MCAPNGARKTKSEHPALPISAEELADCAESILLAGASIMHVHIRDACGQHSLDVDRYRLATEAIRNRVGDRLVIQVTSEACGIYKPQQQMAMVKDLKPEAVSLALKELCPSSADERGAKEFFSWLKAESVIVQYILYSPEEVGRFVRLRDNGVIPHTRPFVLFVLGRYSDDMTGDPNELDGFVAALETDSEWAVCCFGRTEQQAAHRAALMQGHARVGFENNLLLPDGETAEDNAALVALAAGCRNGRPIATADDVRRMFA
jgi:uncharacterized protein (DUF849 family)